MPLPGVLLRSCWGPCVVRDWQLRVSQGEAGSDLRKEEEVRGEVGLLAVFISPWKLGVIHVRSGQQGRELSSSHHSAAQQLGSPNVERYAEKELELKTIWSPSHHYHVLDGQTWASTPALGCLFLEPTQLVSPQQEPIFKFLMPELSLWCVECAMAQNFLVFVLSLTFSFFCLDSLLWLCPPAPCPWQHGRCSRPCARCCICALSFFPRLHALVEGLGKEAGKKNQLLNIEQKKHFLSLLNL